MPRTFRRHLIALVGLPLLLSALPAGAADTTLVATGSTWSYLDDGSDQGTAWSVPGFDDSSWSAGPAQLGYGDGDEATVVSFGSDSSNKHITTYFRKIFQIADPSGYVRADLRLLRDDGAIVYLNGVEVFRSNMPGGAVDSSTTASSTVGGADESTFFEATLDPALLQTGTNLLAVEIHQANPTSSDISFDLELTASDSLIAVNRGPYLQMGTPDGVTIRWRTTDIVESRVQYGPSPTNLNMTIDDAGLTTEHEVRVDGLAANTTYYYSVGTFTETLAGGNSSHFFVTSPESTSPRDTRIWVIGDSGTGNQNAAAVRDAYEVFTGATHTDLWLMLGDNAYNDGTDGQYQTAVFQMYPEMLRKSVVWPTLGNHDGISADSATQTGPYYDIFALPKQGEAGGSASGTEAYYSFDFGNIHFICLDSHETDRSPNGAMLTWLQDDLALTDADWVIAFWHHPPYTKGSHDSDTETRLIEMRANVLPLLEGSGVDLVLSGHSHSFERSFLIDQHYGASSTLQSWMIFDGGDGQPGGDGAYEKPSVGPAPHEGAVYAVAGSSGKISSGPLDHPVMFASLLELGSLVLDVSGNTMTGSFLNDSGQVSDSFTIIKGGGSSGCGNGLCEVGEDCNSCASDCASGSGATCGNGICEAGNGEDCLSCPSDCRGKQNGKPANRYCCGDGDGQNPLSCGDSICTSGGYQCTDVPAVSSCCGDSMCTGSEDSLSCEIDCPVAACGDGTCDPGETSCSCAADCGAPPGSEQSCTNGVDDDCDGQVDCFDSECSADPSCDGGSCEPVGASCVENQDCCSNKCRGKSGRKTCK